MVGSLRWADRVLNHFGADRYVDYRSSAVAGQVRDLLGGEATHVIDAKGSHASLAVCSAVLAPGTAFGVYGIDDIAETGETLRVLAKDRPALNMGTDEASYVNEWHDLWQSGFFTRPGMCDRVMPLAEILPAFDLLKRREAIKIVIRL
jgi:threonine dehydrogenase-like Zn-dependent dehydrogenase